MIRWFAMRRVNRRIDRILRDAGFPKPLLALNAIAWRYDGDREWRYFR